MAMVLCLGQWRDLNATAVHPCRLCGKPVSLGNDGFAISLASGGFEFEHYENECSPEVRDGD